MKIKEINIWNSNDPIIKEGKDFIPWMSVHKAENPNGKCVLVCPGGGYAGVCDSYEGEQFADFYNSFGVDACVLRYTTIETNHGKPVYPKPFVEATRAMRFIREYSQELGINCEKLGIQGFSAGAHLAGWVSTKFNDKLSHMDDLFHKVSARPDFAILCYGVLDLRLITPYGVTGVNLLGEGATDQEVDAYSNVENVTKDTPPTFLMHTQADQIVPVMNSVLYYKKMIENGVKGELHIFQPGPHGIGMGDREWIPEEEQKYLSFWSNNLKNWLLNMI